MDIVLTKPLGYCHGVTRSLRLAEEALSDHNCEETYAFGPLIHNSQEIRRLQDSGLKVINELEEVPEGRTVIIRAHGVPPSTFDRAHGLGLETIDATCRIVTRVQMAAKQLREEGRRVIMYGTPTHPEVVGVVGCINGEAEVVASLTDVEALPPPYDNLGFICQTTKSKLHAQEIKAALEAKAAPHEVKEISTLCGSVIRREQDTMRVAGEVDVMVVVGGKHSSNTHTLVQRSEEMGARTYHVETAEELRRDWFRPEDRVGITAGVSTPVRLVAEVRDWLEALAAEFAGVVAEPVPA